MPSVCGKCYEAGLQRALVCTVLIYLVRLKSKFFFCNLFEVFIF